MRYLIIIGISCLITWSSGYATSLHKPTLYIEKDPFDKINRVIFDFNDIVDRIALKPLAQTYEIILPTLIQTGISNFFSNIDDFWSGINQILQGQINHGILSFMRVAMNTTFGLGGILDIGTTAHLKKQNSDFSQTLGTWGMSSGPYLVLPLLGPSTLRDVIALPINFYGNLWIYKKPVFVRNIGTGLRLLDTRHKLLKQSNILEDIKLNKYELIRDIYLYNHEF